MSKLLYDKAVKRGYQELVKLQEVSDRTCAVVIRERGLSADRGGLGGFLQMSQRCGGTLDDTAGVSLESEKKSLLEVAQTIALLSTISEREQDQNVVTLSTLHAAKGLEWPHVMLVGVTEGLLPFKLGDDDNPTGRADGPMSEGILQRLQEERRLMYVGITRAQRSLAVSWAKRRKKGREMVAAQPSRFIAEMALEQATTKEDPRAKLKALRAEFAKKAQDAADASAASAT